MKKNKIFKKLFLPLFCGMLLLSIGLLMSNIDSVLKLNTTKAAASGSVSITINSTTGFGQFNNGYVYTYTDPAKVDSFRAKTIDRDFTKVTVNSSSAHGSAQNPFVLSTPEDWTKLVKYCGGSGNTTAITVVLANDIDFSGQTFYPITIFYGNFYGQNYRLKNITVEQNGWKYWNGSSFAEISSNGSYKGYYGPILACNKQATFCDITFENYKYVFNNLTNNSTNPHSMMGAVVANVNSSTAPISFLNVHTIGNMLGNGIECNSHIRIGGLVGIANTSTFVYRCSTNITSTGILSTSERMAGVGGIYGHSNGATYLDKIYDSVTTVNQTSNRNNMCGGSITGWHMGTVLIENFVGSVVQVGSGGGPAASLMPFSEMFNPSKADTSTFDLRNCWSSGIRKNINTGKITALPHTSTYELSNNPKYKMTNVNLSKSGLANWYATLRLPAVTTVHGNDIELISSAVAFLSNYSNIWDVEKLEQNFQNYTPDNNPVKSPLKIVIPSKVETTYNGAKVNLNMLFGLDESVFSVTYDADKNYTDAGSYVAHATLVNTDLYTFRGMLSGETTIDIPVKINKLKVDIGDFKPYLKDDGTLDSDYTLSSKTPPYDWDADNNQLPEFGLEYQIGGVWTTSLPTNAGTYNVRAYLINDCNYLINDPAQTSFTKPKEVVEVPHLTNSSISSSAIVGSVTTVQYTGEFQEFYLVNNKDATELVDVVMETTDGVISYNPSRKVLRAKAVGEYTITVRLADNGANTRWGDSSSNTSATRIITLKITKAELEVKYEDDTVTSWSKGERKNIVINVTGVNTNAEPPVLGVYYTVDGVRTDVATSSMELIGDQIVVTVNLDSFQANKRYTLNVELAADRAANNNYTLSNSTNTGFTFLILTATIREIEVEWQYSNLIIGSGIVATDGISVDYNGQEYAFILNEAKLPTGVVPSYSNIRNANAGTYITTVSLSCAPDSGYEIASGVQTFYTINWTIAPIEYDLSNIKWLDDFTYSGLFQEMKPIQLPNWITINSSVTGENEMDAVGDNYVASYSLEGDINHIFVLKDTCAPEDTITIQANGLQAIVTHKWAIKKVVIKVSNLAQQWTFIDYTDVNGNSFSVPEPTALQDYATQLVLKYYSDENFTNEISLTDIIVDIENKSVYYVKVSLDASESDNYELVNTSHSDLNYAFAVFSVGGGYKLIDADISEKEVFYNGSEQVITATHKGLTFVITYYKGSTAADGIFDEGTAPIDVGDYLVTIECTNPKYLAKESSFIFTIKPLELVIDGWTLPDGLTPPDAIIISEQADDSLDVNSLFEYKIYDLSDNEVTGTLGWNTPYIIKALPSSNAVFTDSAKAEYSFRTGFNPDAGDDHIHINKPVLVQNTLVWNGKDQTFQIANWNLLEEYLEIKSGSLTQKDANEYVVWVQIKSGLNVAWTDGSSGDIELKFKILPLELSIDVPEIRYNGTDINVFDYLDPNIDWLNWFISSGNTGKAVGSYTLTLTIKDECVGNVVFVNPSVSRVGDNNTLTVEWQILPAVIAGDWDTSGKYPVFKTENAADADKIEVVYLDQNLKEVKPQEMVNGIKYTAQAKIKDEYKDSYVFANDQISVNTEFTYKLKKSFIKENWLWLLIAAAVLLFLIILIIIIVAAKKKKKKKEEAAALAAAEKKKEEKEENTNTQAGGQYFGGMPYGTSYAQPMPMQQPMPQPMPQVQYTTSPVQYVSSAPVMQPFAPAMPSMPMGAVVQPAQVTPSMPTNVASVPVQTAPSMPASPAAQSAPAVHTATDSGAVAAQAVSSPSEDRLKELEAKILELTSSLSNGSVQGASAVVSTQNQPSGNVAQPNSVAPISNRSNYNSMLEELKKLQTRAEESEQRLAKLRAERTKLEQNPPRYYKNDNSDL